MPTTRPYGVSVPTFPSPPSSSSSPLYKPINPFSISITPIFQSIFPLFLSFQSLSTLLAYTLHRIAHKKIKKKKKTKMAAATTALSSSSISMLDSSLEVDKLTSEIFSILETKFLFGYEDPKLSLPQIPLQDMRSGKHVTGKVRILSIDGAAATDGVLAAKSLSHLESSLRLKSGNSNARISDFFDVVAGSGVGGILAALLFTSRGGGAPIFTADEALKFVTENRKMIFRSSSGGVLRRMFRRSKNEKKMFRKVFGESTLKDTVKAVLIPCFDLTTRSPFVFSRADAVEIHGYDFKMADVCLATSADPTVVGAIEMSSVDRQTKIAAVGGGVVMNNPTAAAITHVLNNKQEFPFCNGVEDLIVVSLGNGESDFGAGDLTSSPARRAVQIAGEGASDLVDQAVSMAFGQSRTSNYVRIQANGNGKFGKNRSGKREMHTMRRDDLVGGANSDV